MPAPPALLPTGATTLEAVVAVAVAPGELVLATVAEVLELVVLELAAFALSAANSASAAAAAAAGSATHEASTHSATRFSYSARLAAHNTHTHAQCASEC